MAIISAPPLPLPLLSVDDLDMTAQRLPFAEKLLGTSYELNCLNPDRSVSLVIAVKSHNKANQSNPTANSEHSSPLPSLQPSAGSFQVTQVYALFPKPNPPS